MRVNVDKTRRDERTIDLDLLPAQPCYAAHLYNLSITHCNIRRLRSRPSTVYDRTTTYNQIEFTHLKRCSSFDRFVFLNITAVVRTEFSRIVYFYHTPACLTPAAETVLQ